MQETDPWYLHHYMPNNGFPEAREKIAASLNRRFGEHFDANNIMMCTGAAGGLELPAEGADGPPDRRF